MPNIYVHGRCYISLQCLLQLDAHIISLAQEVHVRRDSYYLIVSATENTYKANYILN